MKTFSKPVVPAIGAVCKHSTGTLSMLHTGIALQRRRLTSLLAGWVLCAAGSALVHAQGLAGRIDELSRQIEQSGRAQPAAPERALPSASATEAATGHTTTSQGNPDGSRTVTLTDKEGRVISKKEIPARGNRTESGFTYDPRTGRTTTVEGNADGSRKITVTDKSGTVLEQRWEPGSGADKPSASATDPKTGVTSSARHGRDGKRVTAKSQSWTSHDGGHHTVELDNEGNQSHIVKAANGTLTTTRWDAENRQTVVIRRPDGSQSLITPSDDGYVLEKTTKPDGSRQTIKRDHSGRVYETTRHLPNGRTVHTNEFGTITETIPGNAGRLSSIRTDVNGNQFLTHLNADGTIAEQREKLVKPREAGERYFETALGGRPGEWRTLPPSIKAKYAASEADQKEVAGNELRRQRETEARARLEERIRLLNVELDKQTAEKRRKTASSK